MKNATHHKAKGKARPRIIVRGLHSLPDGLTPRDLEWENAPCVVAALEQRFARWRKQQDEINADWLKASRQRVQDAAAEVDADKLKLALAAEEEKRLDYFASDAEETARYVAALAAAIKKQAADRNAAWRASAEARLRRATAEINRDIVSRERQHFGVRKRHER